jgi:hypothetical protein
MSVLKFTFYRLSMEASTYGDVTPCTLIEACRSFGETSVKFYQTARHHITKIVLVIAPAVRTSILANYENCLTTARNSKLGCYSGHCPSS